MSTAPSPPLRLTIAELQARVGEPLGVSGWRPVTQHRVDLFADATDDHSPLHVDPQAARDGPYGATVAHGFLTLSLVPALTAEVFDVADAAAFVNYGVNRVRFPAPLLVGSRVRLSTRLTAIEPGPAGPRLVLGFEIHAEGSEKPVAIGETVVLVVTGSPS